MPPFRKIFTYILYSFSLILFCGQPSFSETTISEKPLPTDILVEEVFQPVSGLPVGKIQAVRGEVRLYHRDPTVTYRVKTGLPLYYGDTISTMSNGRVLCRLIDGTIFSLAAATTLTIIQCNYNSARKTGVSFLSLNRGHGFFKVNPSPELFSYEFKIQTMTAFVQAQKAEFIIKSNQGATEIATFDQSRLEVTNLAVPEELFFLTDFQKTIVADKPGPQMAETVTHQESMAMMAEVRLMPETKSFASSPDRYSQKDSADETPESDINSENEWN